MKCSLGGQTTTKTNNSEGVELIDSAFNADFSCSSWFSFLVLNLNSSYVISRRFTRIVAQKIAEVISGSKRVCQK